MFFGFSAQSSWRSLLKTLKFAVWALSLNFVHDFTLFVINIHQNRLISPISTTRDHFHFRQIWDCFDTISLQFQVLVKKTNDWSGKIAHFLWYVKMDSPSFHQLFEPNKKRFIALPFICCRLPTNWHLSKKFTHRPPRKYFFWIWDPTKDM